MIKQSTDMIKQSTDVTKLCVDYESKHRYYIPTTPTDFSYNFGVNYHIGGNKDHRLQRYENSDVRNNTHF